MVDCHEPAGQAKDGHGDREVVEVSEEPLEDAVIAVAEVVAEFGNPDVAVCGEIAAAVA